MLHFIFEHVDVGQGLLSNLLLSLTLPCATLLSRFSPHLGPRLIHSSHLHVGAYCKPTFRGTFRLVSAHERVMAYIDFDSCLAESQKDPHFNEKSQNNTPNTLLCAIIEIAACSVPHKQ